MNDSFNHKSAFRSILFAIVLLTAWGASAQNMGVSEPPKRKVTLVVFMDNSRSMHAYKQRVRDLVAGLSKALQKTNCMDIHLGVVAEGNYQAARRKKGRLDPFVYGSGSIARYLDLNDESSLGIFANRIQNMYDGPGDESNVEHVFYTAAFDSATLSNRDLFVAIVVSDVGISADTPGVPGIEFVSNIQLLLGKTRFMALGLGIDSRQKDLSCPADMPQHCSRTIERDYGAEAAKHFDGGVLYPNTVIPYGEMANRCAREHGLASPRLLEDFARGSGGRFINICDQSYMNAVESFTDRIFRAAKCHLIM